MLAVLLAIGFGFATPIQTVVNTRLRGAIGGSPLAASMVSFAVGTIALTLVVFALSGSPVPSFSAAGDEPWWVWTGGLLGMLYLTGNLIIFPRLGGVQTVVLPIVGQILMGLIIDSLGLFGIDQLPLTWTRVLGAVIVLIGVLTVVGVLSRRQDVAFGGGAWGWRLLAVFMGMASAAQSAVNGRLGTVIGSAVEAAQVSFFIGFVALVVLVLVTRQKVSFRQARGPWWIWTGGALGALFVFGNAFLTPIIGAGATVVAVLTGQMAMSVVIDHLGIGGVQKRPVRSHQIIGILTIVCGAILLRLF